MTMSIRLLPASVAVLGLLAACSPEPDKPVANKVTANETEIIVPSAPPEVNVANPSEEAAGVGLNLAPDELTLVLPNGSARHVVFGMAKADAVKMISAALGSPIEEAVNQDCGAGALAYAAFRNGLSLYFEDGKFAGWDLDGRENGKFTTGNGIGIGTTRKELEASGSAVDVGETSIGNEFMMGGMSGLLSTAAPDGKVTNLWAGTTCIAR